jgi:hypothetical protein
LVDSRGAERDVCRAGPALGTPARSSRKEKQPQILRVIAQDDETNIGPPRVNEQLALERHDCWSVTLVGASAMRLRGLGQPREGDDWAQAGRAGLEYDNAVNRERDAERDASVWRHAEVERIRLECFKEEFEARAGHSVADAERGQHQTICKAEHLARKLWD